MRRKTIEDKEDDDIMAILQIPSLNLCPLSRRTALRSVLSSLKSQNLCAMKEKL